MSLTATGRAAMRHPADDSTLNTAAVWTILALQAVDVAFTVPPVTWGARPRRRAS